MSLKQIARRGFERIEGGFDWAFGPAWNPLYYLGALGWFFYWIVIVSGIYLYIVFDTGITNAYDSVEYLTRVQWYAGGVMRSLHRYASDALVIVIMVHLAREYVMDRYRGVRWFSWFTGVPLLWFLFACGISGYWVVWDKLAQYIAIATTEWLDTLGIFGEPIARNFLHETTLSGRFFTLMVFFHIVVPLFMLFVMWLHIQRISRPKVNPHRGLAAGTLAMLLVLSFVKPAVSQGPADLNTVPAVVNLDWFYLQFYPLLDHLSGLTVWMLAVGATLLLFALPWLPPKRPEPAAVVALDNCNGCGRCFQDCPYSAVNMQPRSDGQAFTQEAVVAEHLCVSCGICVGACPTATPFRRAGELISGIELPHRRMSELRERILEVTAGLQGHDRVLVYGCDHGPDLDALQGDGVAVLRLPCIAMLPPSFLDFVISRRLVDGVFLTGCREGQCYHRLGIEWMEARMERRRDPYLRERVPRERIGRFWAGATRGRQLREEVRAFRERFKTLAPYARPQTPPGRKEEMAGHG